MVSEEEATMAAPDQYRWRRDKDGLGVWEHRGKVALAGFGHSPVDRRWDGVSMDKTLGAYSILACQKAMDDAGVSPDQIDGVICCDSHIAGGSGGSASQWAPRPYFARGARQWTAPWGNHGGNDFINIFPHRQYCLKYGGKHDDLAPFVVNQHRNGLLTPWGYNATHKVPQLTIEDYVSSRYILNPLRLWDCDRPVNASAAYLFTTADRARDMRQPPVYVLNHSQHNFRQRTTQADLDEIEDWTDRAARRMYEGAGLGAKDVDIFNPYDGYAPMAQFFLEAFQWHGVKRGEAFSFYAGDIRVEGPHPFCSSGGNLGNGRTRTAMYTDSIEQLRGTAGTRQVKIRAETALAAFTTPSSGGWIMFGKHPG